MVDLWKERFDATRYRVACDPSVNSLALSVWSAGAELLWAGLVLPTKELSNEVQTKPATIVHSIDFHVSEEDIELEKELSKIQSFTVETPEIYPQNPVPPADLLLLAKVVGALSMRFDRYGVDYQEVLPRVWGGQMDKHKKKLRVMKRLTKAEKGRIDYPSAASLEHNVIDAIGIGLYAYDAKRWARQLGTAKKRKTLTARKRF